MARFNCGPFDFKAMSAGELCQWSVSFRSTVKASETLLENGWHLSEEERAGLMNAIGDLADKVYLIHDILEMRRMAREDLIACLSRTEKGRSSINQIAADELERRRALDSAVAVAAEVQWVAASNCGVYFIHGEGTDLVKIGLSNNITRRLHGLQPGCPVRLTILGVIPVEEKNLRQVEAELHERFKHLRTRNEWFRFTDEVKDFIRSNTTYCSMASRRARDNRDADQIASSL